LSKDLSQIEKERFRRAFTRVYIENAETSKTRAELCSCFGQNGDGNKEPCDICYLGSLKGPHSAKYYFLKNAHCDNTNKQE
jgi:hypothetical protein